MANLNVWANPWHAVDHQGRPCGVASMGVAGPVRLIGATKKLRKIADAPVDGLRTEIHDVTFDFSTDAVALSDDYDHYHRRLVREGAVFAADKETADTCGTTFVPYAQAIVAAHKGASERHKKNHGVELPPLPAPAPAATVTEEGHS